VLGRACALLVLVLLRATGRGSDRLHLRRERRGDRRRDPVVTALASPLVRRAGARRHPAQPAAARARRRRAGGLVWLASPDVSGLERPS
jgi:hypothetical protein